MSVKLVDPVTGIRRLLYLVSPNETSFAKYTEVPNYVGEAIPYFILLILVEYFICVAKKRRKARIADGISSVSAGLYNEVFKLVFRSIDFTVFCYLHERYCIYELPWNSIWTWILTMLGIDFGYYWLHRAAHEINLFWSGHQVHHSSESYNLTTALRQSVLQPFFSLPFYMPLSLFIPPSIYLVHTQMNLLYQFWIHTELIKTLGPLEWILNTPSHHRVHHGRNPYCIDSNYGGTLIIWDRMFGTFKAEGEQVVYGLVHPLETNDPHEVQMVHLKYVVKTFGERKGFSEKLRTLFYGPGWQPGTPRLGNHEDLPKVESPAFVYDPQASKMTYAYCIFHFILANILYSALLANKTKLSAHWILCGSVLILWGLTSFGNLLDKTTRQYGAKLECLRCIATILLVNMVWPRGSAEVLAVQVIFGLSLLIILKYEVFTKESGKNKLS